MVWLEAPARRQPCRFGEGHSHDEGSSWQFIALSLRPYLGVVNEVDPHRVQLAQAIH
jgi:hypothetical protein